MAIRYGNTTAANTTNADLIMNYFGQNLKTLRLEKGFSQTELGERLYKGQKTIGNWETGYSEPCIDDLLNISELFEIDVDTLLRKEIEQSNPKAKAKRSRYKKEELKADNSPLAVTNVKRVLQEAAQHNSTLDNADVTWRDKYIALLEKHLFANPARHMPEENIHGLMAQILTVQKMVAELISSSSNDTQSSRVS